MKVKDLKALLEGVDENAIVLIEDVNGSSLGIVNWCVSKDGDTECVYLSTQEEFPDEWFDNGVERIWLYGSYPVVPKNVEETEELYLVDKDAFGDEKEHRLTLTFHDGYATGDYVRVVYPKLADVSIKDIEDMDKYQGGTIKDSGYYTPMDICTLFGKIERKEGGDIMDDTNGHDPELVREINQKWAKYSYRFKPILLALYERDIDEITDCDSFLFNEWKAWPEYDNGCETGKWGAYNIRALEDLKECWEFHAENYLKHIADDQDLKTIITFVRCDISEGAGRDKQFSK